MAALLELRRKVLGALGRIEVVGPLLARLSVGAMFAQAGWGKLNDLATPTGFFETLGIPYPELMAPFVAGVEFGGGLLIVLGLFTRLAAMPLIVTMIVAIATAYREQITGVVDVLALSEFTYIAVLAWLAIVGAGAASLDALLVRLVAGPSAAAQPAGVRVAA